MKSIEHHRTQCVGWLRASVLGANDGMLSTASVIVGAATAEASRGSVLVVGMVGLVAGAMSITAREYVSVSSQAHAESADLEPERRELATDDKNEHAELRAIYVSGSLEPNLTRQVAAQLMAKEAIAADASDELGIGNTLIARPVQAALASASSFTVGAALPLLPVFLMPYTVLAWAVSGGSLLFLASLGAVVPHAIGSPIEKSIARVTIWGALAIAINAAVRAVFGAAL